MSRISWFPSEKKVEAARLESLKEIEKPEQEFTSFKFPLDEQISPKAAKLIKENNFKEGLYWFIKEYGNVTFDEFKSRGIEDVFPESEYVTFSSSSDYNIVYWPKIKENLLKILIELSKEGWIKMKMLNESMTLLTYDYVPDLPIAKVGKSYKEPHWMPLIIIAVKESE